MENVLTSSPSIVTRGSPALVWTGRVLTGLILAFLLLDALGKLLMLAPVIEGTQKVGYAVEVIRPLGVVLAVSALLHLAPRTQFLGAVLLTAYLGGATATHVRMGAPFWMPVLMGVILWVAYCLRSPQLRAFLLSPSR
jgi:DoxX-like family